MAGWSRPGSRRSCRSGSRPSCSASWPIPGAASSRIWAPPWNCTESSRHDTSPDHDPLDLRRDRRRLADPLSGAPVHSGQDAVPLARFADVLTAADPPLVSAIIPAKDEEATLADCLASVCAQAYPKLEILVIDDRSVDRTRQIAAEFAARDPRLRVLSNDHLPPGWTGKTYVLQQAADQAARPSGSGSSTPTRCMPRSSWA